MANDTTPQPEETPIDPYVAQIAASMKNVVDPKKLMEKPPEPKPPASDGVPLGEMVAREKELEAQKAAAGAGAPAPASDGNPQPKGDEPPKGAPAASAGANARPPVVIKVVKKDTVTPPTPTPVQTPTAPQVDPAAEAQRKADEEYINGLTPDQKEQLDVARFADESGARKDVFKETLGYFRDYDAFIEKNPGITPDSEDLQKFVEEHAPKWTDAEFRRMERGMIEKQVGERVTREATKSVDQVRRELLELKSKPIMDKAIGTVVDIVTKPDPENKELVPLRKEVMDTIDTQGYEAAMEKYPIEAPIAQGARIAAEEWTAIRTGLRTWDLQHNQIHQWLIGMISQQGAAMMGSPESERIRNGKSFVPAHQMMELMRTNPAEAAKHWTFSDDEITEMIGNSAILDYNAQIKKLRASGWAPPADKVLSQPQNPGKGSGGNTASDTGDSEASPKAGSRSIPGPTTTEVRENPNADFYSKIYPGWEAALSGK